MYVLACCDDNGVCIGFLGKDGEVIENKEKLTEEHLMTFRGKKDTNEKCTQINLGRLLLPNGAKFRVTPVRVPNK